MIAPKSAAELRVMLGLRSFTVGFTAISLAMRGLPLSEAQRAAFVEMSGGVEPPEGGFSDALLIKPRRAGGSEWLATEGFFECAFGGHEAVLAPGQLAAFPIVCARRDQAREVVNYGKGIASLPAMRPLVESTTADEIVFRNGTVFRVTTCDVNAVSGTTAIGYGLSEFAKWPGEESAEPDRVIVDTLDPATAPLVGAPVRRRLRETSAFIEEGLAYEIDRDCFGNPDAPTLVFRGCFRLLNPNIDRAWLGKERKRVGRSTFAREYGEWDSPPVWQPSIVDGWFGADVIERCTDARGILEANDRVTYYGALDAAFRGDGFTLAICHREYRDDGTPITVIDGVWGWRAESGKTLPVETTVARSAEIIRRYRAAVWADQFAFDPLRESYVTKGIRLREGFWTATGPDAKAVRFRRVRDAMIDGLVRLPGKDKETTREFANVRGRLLRSGGEQIEARSGHDDRVHAVVLAVSEAMTREPDRRRPEHAPTGDSQIARALFPAGNLAFHEPDDTDPIEALDEKHRQIFDDLMARRGL